MNPIILVSQPLWDIHGQILLLFVSLYAYSLLVS